MSKRQKVRKCRKVNCEHNAFKHKNTRRYGETCLRPNIECISKIEEVALLNIPVSSAEYDPRKLSNAELEHCIRVEKRKSGQKILQKEKQARQQAT